MKHFCIIKENVAYVECVIQSSMFYSFYLLFSILLCNVDSALVSDSNAYIWISNCIQMFELYSNVRIYIRMLTECVFSTCFWKMASSDDEKKKNIWKRKDISLLLLLSFLNPKISFFIGKRRGCLCWEWRNARGFSWTNVTKCGGGWG